VRKELSHRWLAASVGFLAFFLSREIGRTETDRQKENLVGLVKNVRTEGTHTLHQNGRYLEGNRQPVVTVSYNTSGNRTEEIPSQSDLVGLVEGISYRSAKSFYFYNLSGKIIERVVANFDGTLMVRTLYFYDERGRIREAKTESYDGAMSGTTTYTYNEKGRLIEAAGINGEFTYSYDANGHLIEERKDGGPSVYLLYTYDEQGKKRTTTSYDPHDPGLGIEKVETTYDIQGKPVTSLTYYTHRKNGVPEEEKDAKARKKIPRPKGWFYAYEYDAHGNWVKRTDWECETSETSRKLVCKNPSLVVYRTISYYSESENKK
jgi:hypothetical protein